MNKYFVRVYVMKDGTKHEVSSIYQDYDQAVDDLNKFNPSGPDVDDMQDVAYAQIETRFSPAKIWQ